jgi:hypothetical protein
VQVADRWHLLNNLIETLVRSLERHRCTMSEVQQKQLRCAAPVLADRDEQRPTQALLHKQQNRDRRLIR